MIFTPALARAVLAGRKTQTRRLINGGQSCRYKPGHDYAVQPGRGKPAVGRIKVLDVREQHAGDITHPDAKAEGFRNTAAFKADWVRLHDKAWTTGRGDDATEAAAVDRFNTHHAHRPVWVITFTTTTDTPRFLAHPTANSGDYTEQRHRAIDDLEVIDAQTQARYARDALAFCIGRQLQRQQQHKAKKAARGRSMRRPPNERRAA